MAEVTLAGHPHMRIGTPAHTGPYSRLRGNYAVWLQQGRQAWEMVIFGPYSVRDAAAILGLSPTTTWRRAWWYEDWIALPTYYGYEPGPVPHQRGTRAVPRGRPVCMHDTAEVVRQLRAADYTFGDIIESHRTVPKHIRDYAAGQLAEFRAHLALLDDDKRADLLGRYPARARAELESKG